MVHPIEPNHQCKVKLSLGCLIFAIKVKQLEYSYCRRCLIQCISLPVIRLWIQVIIKEITLEVSTCCMLYSTTHKCLCIPTMRIVKMRTKRKALGRTSIKLSNGKLSLIPLFCEGSCRPSLKKDIYFWTLMIFFFCILLLLTSWINLLCIKYTYIVYIFLAKH